MRGFHSFQNLEQPPAFSTVALGGERSFAFEIDVINQCVATPRGGADALELALDIFAISRLREHFRQRIPQTRDEELRLEIDGIGEESAKLFHLGRILCGRKFGPGIPRACSLFFAEEKAGKFRAARGSESDQFRKTFLERPARAFGIPDEMPYAERSEIFSSVPRSESGDGPSAFVLPDTFADSLRFRLRDLERGADLCCAEKKDDRESSNGTP